MPEPLTRLLTPKEVATYLRISESEVHRLVRSGRLNCVQVTPRKRVFTTEQLDQFIQDQSRQSSRPKTLIDTPGFPPVGYQREGGDSERTDVSRASLRKEMMSWE